MKEELYKKLEKYQEKGCYPFHMPGHKRNTELSPAHLMCFSQDITEIEGFDNLHHPQGVIKEALQRASQLYQTESSYFSVNGSTGALLAAVSAACKRGGRILMARNCHKAVYYGAYLRGLQVSYVYPKKEPVCGLDGSISPEDIRAALEKYPDTQAVILTSPTYEGVVSDIGKIADIVHRAGAVLLVDEAHGSHLRFHKDFPASALSLEADLVVHSLHKTLPSLTQTALLHRNSHRVAREDVQKFMEIYQTSSPSYLLMASMDACICLLQEKGEALFDEYMENLRKCREELKKLEYIHLADEEIADGEGVYALDPSKLIFSVRGCPVKGGELSRILRNKYRLEMEMEHLDYVLALTSIGDTKEGFTRLTEAMLEVDHSLKKSYVRTKRPSAGAYAAMEQVLTIAEGMESPKKRCALALSKGKISGEFVYLYPPGIPLLVPGERITEQFISDAFSYQKEGLSLQGLSDRTGQSICVVEE